MNMHIKCKSLGINVRKLNSEKGQSTRLKNWPNPSWDLIGMHNLPKQKRQQTQISRIAKYYIRWHNRYLTTTCLD